MNNEVTNIVLTNVSPGMPADVRGMRYEFANGWSLSVHAIKRGKTHEAAVLNAHGRIEYTDRNLAGYSGDLLFLTSDEVIEIINVMSENKDNMMLRLNAWVDDKIVESTLEKYS